MNLVELNELIDNFVEKTAGPKWVAEPKKWERAEKAVFHKGRKKYKQPYRVISDIYLYKMHGKKKKKKKASSLPELFKLADRLETKLSQS